MTEEDWLMFACSSTEEWTEISDDDRDRILTALEKEKELEKWWDDRNEFAVPKEEARKAWLRRNSPLVNALK